MNRTQLIARVPSALRKRFKAKCQAERYTMTEVVVELIKQYLEKP